MIILDITKNHVPFETHRFDKSSLSIGFHQCHDVYLPPVTDGATSQTVLKLGLIQNTWKLSTHGDFPTPRVNGKKIKESCAVDFNDEIEIFPYTIKMKLPYLTEISQDFGILEPFIQDPSVSEIMVNGADSIYIETHGKIQKTNCQFETESSLLNYIQRLLHESGRRLDEASPFVDAKLGKNMRLHAIIPPLSLGGPILTIRKFLNSIRSFEELLKSKMLNFEMKDFLKEEVSNKRNILISGGTSSGKTTLLNILSSCIAADERIITLEDAAELALQQPHVVSLQVRKSNIENKGEISIRELLQNALRMRPDRIIVGECRGSETLDMLQAMNTGHQGSMTTLHANSPRDALKRLEMLMLMSGCHFPVKAMRQQIASAIDLLIHVEKDIHGIRRMTHISKVSGMEADVILLHPHFEWNGTEWLDTGTSMTKRGIRQL
ncbi:MAG: CpaF family protein [Deltaproteobacteria bacterium]|nr:CpaF family protein [Deltaproteobacteria bacterium]